MAEMDEGAEHGEREDYPMAPAAPYERSDASAQEALNELPPPTTDGLLTDGPPTDATAEALEAANLAIRISSNRVISARAARKAVIADIQGARHGVDDARAALRDAKNDLRDARADLDDAKADLEDAKADLADARADLQAAQRLKERLMRTAGRM